MDYDYDEPPDIPEDCPALMEDACPVMLEEKDEPCDGCRWLTKNPNYQGEKADA